MSDSQAPSTSTTSDSQASPTSTTSDPLALQSSSTMPPVDRSEGRNVHIYHAKTPTVVLGGLILSNGVTNRNLYSMLDIFIGYEVPNEVSLDEEKPFLRDEEGTKIEKSGDPLRPGRYYIVTTYTIKVSDEVCLLRTESTDQSGTRGQSFRNAVRLRDRRCVVSGKKALGADVGVWFGFEVAHIFPLAYGSSWESQNFSRWISLPPATGGTINSVQNGLLLTSTIHTLFDLYAFSINPDDNYKIVCFSFDVENIGGKYLDQDFLDNPQRPVDELLRWHFRQAVLANVKGAGEPIFEHDFPPGSDIVGDILGGPRSAERMESSAPGSVVIPVGDLLTTTGDDKVRLTTTGHRPPPEPPSLNLRRKYKTQPSVPQNETTRSSELEDGLDGLMSFSVELELDDLASDAGSDADEETGLTGKESQKYGQKQRQSVPSEARITGNPTVTEEAKKLADRHMLKDLLGNALLIGLWYIFALSISIYNKWMFGPDHLDFQFPLFTTSLHMLVQFSLASLVLLVRPGMRPKPPPLDLSDLSAGHNPLMTPLFYVTRLLPCGTATSLDIGLGNTSLRFISLTFLTMCKSSSLAFVLLFAFLFRLEQASWKLCAIIATMTAGVVMMVAGETEFNAVGFFLVIASAFFSGFRWALTQILLLRHPATSNPYATIFFLAPIMFVTLSLLALFVEGPRAVVTGLRILTETKGVVPAILLLLFPGCLAFGLISSEFALLKRTSVVTLSICGIFKEVVTISTAGIVFHDPLTPINVSGLVVTIASIAVYNYLKITKMRKEARREMEGEVVQRTSMDLYDAVREDSIEIEHSRPVVLSHGVAEGSTLPGKLLDHIE